MYHCETCGADVAGLKAARKHAKQGHKTQREAFNARELHALTLKQPPTGASRRKTPSVPRDEMTPVMKLAGIANEDAAKRDLKRRFGSRPLETPVSRPGARFYVTARRGNQVAWLMGPYSSHVGAQTALPQARQLLADKYPHEEFMSIGTASRAETVQTVFGRGGAARTKGRTTDRGLRRKGVR